jgi:exopolysaccharide biosynthesis WecB/TagA/CpsF family protein
MDIGRTLTLLLTISGGLIALAPLYLLVLAVAALLHRHAEPAPGRGESRIAVLVPAHDEEPLISGCLASLRSQDYPAGRFRLVVIADNCSDGTADAARKAGAEVLVRDEPELRGKGRALRWAMDRLLSELDPPDAIAVVDADSTADPGMLRALEAVLAGGAEAAQADYLVLDGSGSGTPLRQAAFLLFHRTRFAGRAALGLPCSLVGNGMMFRRNLLERLPWSAFSGAEDLEYSIDLRIAGVRPGFAAAASVAGPAPGFGRGAATQRMRWEGGRFHVVRTRLPRLLWAALRHRDASLAEASLDLAIPPLGLLTMLALLGDAASVAATVGGLVPPWAGATWWAASLLLTTYVFVGLRAARAPSSAYRALLHTPRFLVAKIGTYLRMTRGLGADRWERTERPAEASLRKRRKTVASSAPALSRVIIGGVPIDTVDEQGAAERMMAAIGADAPLQVSTVNLQFLVTARRRPEVRKALNGAGLNVADGAPVLWLARLLGHPLPARVAGADLVPTLMGLAAQRGARVFLLGGTGGVAAEAATLLERANPGLQITGTHEPPPAAVDEMADDEILSRVGEAGADILLVAFGHPKQDLWIARNLDRLPVSVAIGVGGTFDLIAGRLHRAPAWARRSGLEWLFRLAQEPRRLGLRYAACAVWLLGVLVPATAWQRLVGAPNRIAHDAAEARAAEPGHEAAIS